MSWDIPPPTQFFNISLGERNIKMMFLEKKKKFLGVFGFPGMTSNQLTRGLMGNGKKPSFSLLFPFLGG